MAMFSYVMKHKPGRANQNADYLSRYTFEQPRISGDEGAVAISRLSTTPVRPELALLDF